MFLSVSHGFSKHCLEYILPASMNHMNGKVEYILTNVWGTNMNNKTIKPKLEMNLRSVVGGFNPFEKLWSVKQVVIPSTCSVSMKGQIRGSFGGAPHVIIWLTVWGTHTQLVMRALAFWFSIYSLALLHTMRDKFPAWNSWNGIFKILITTKNIQRNTHDL